MSREIDYQKLYEQYKEDYNELRKDYDEFKATADEIQQELEKIIEESDQKNEELQILIVSLKEQMKKNKIEAEDQISRLEREQERQKQNLNVLEEKYLTSQKFKVDLENDNEILISQNRMFESMVADLETRIDQSLEELALVQTELEDNKNNSQEHIQRLKQQLQETEQELFAVQIQNQKKIEALEQNVVKIRVRNKEQTIQDETQINVKQAMNIEFINDQIQTNQQILNKESTKSYNFNTTTKELNGSVNFLINEDFSKKLTLEQKLKNCSSNIQQLRLNNQGFKTSLGLVSTLIKDLDEKMNEIRKKRQKKLNERQLKHSINKSQNQEYIQITNSAI